LEAGAWRFQVSHNRTSPPVFLVSVASKGLEFM